MPAAPEADIAAEALSLMGSARQVAPFSARVPDFDLARAYDVAERVRVLRAARGERAIGRKIGFTNRTVWSRYGISAPIWNHMFDTTVQSLRDAGGAFGLGQLPEPRIEPELVLHLARAPHADMSDAELVGCIDLIAHGFEIVSSIFPGWTFSAADAVAAYGVHSALLIGEPLPLDGATDADSWADAIAGFSVEMRNQDGLVRRGHARDVLDSPLDALRFLLVEIDRHPGSPPVQAGEIITTGTLTEAMPARPGDSWTSRIDGLPVAGVEVRFS